MGRTANIIHVPSSSPTEGAAMLAGGLVPEKTGPRSYTIARDRYGNIVGEISVAGKAPISTHFVIEGQLFLSPKAARLQRWKGRIARVRRVESKRLAQLVRKVGQ